MDEDSEDQTYLSIGQFSVRCRLSAKALRLYDRLGLVVPVRVDPVNGYRWYSVDQVDRARVVGLLRRLDMPLAAIVKVVELPPVDAVATVRDHVADAARATRERAELSDYVCLLLNNGDRSGDMSNTFTVEVRTVPARAVLSAVRRVQVIELAQTLGALLGRMREAGPGLAGIAGCPYLVYYADVSQDSDGPVEIVRPMADLAQAEDAAARLPDVQARVEPEHDEAFVRMTMAQTRGGAAAVRILDTLREYVASSNGELFQPPRQIMIADWRTAEPDDFAADLAVPYHPVIVPTLS